MKACVVATVLLLSGLVSSTPFSKKGSEIRVKSGELIQSAIDSAQYGDKILVEAGTYSEQLLITKSGISLVGVGDVLLQPPASPVENQCSGLAGLGTQAGICIIGSGVDLLPFPGQEHRRVNSVERRIRDVEVSRLTISGFGLNIAIVGAQNTRIHDNTLTSGSAYGVLSDGSKGSRITDNKISAIITETEFFLIAICVDDVSDADVADNRISGYFLGLCVETSGAEIEKNYVTESCLGVFVDPGVSGVDVHDNHIANALGFCQVAVNTTATGITLAGVVKSRVRANFVEGQQVGINVVDDRGVVSTQNVISRNKLRDNDLDVSDTSTGDNEFRNNACSTSTPPGLCNS